MLVGSVPTSLCMPSSYVHIAHASMLAVVLVVASRFGVKRSMSRTSTSWWAKITARVGGYHTTVEVSFDVEKRDWYVIHIMNM